jgi:hypothetical protein
MFDIHKMTDNCNFFQRILDGEQGWARGRDSVIVMSSKLEDSTHKMVWAVAYLFRYPRRNKGLWSMMQLHSNLLTEEKTGYGKAR